MTFLRGRNLFRHGLGHLLVGVLHQLKFDGEFHRLADQHPAGLQHLVPGQPEVLAVQGGPQVESGPLVAPGTLAPSLLPGLQPHPPGPGVPPGRGPAPLALFGYDPWTTKIGRGALSGLGLGLDFQPGDVAARLNFCTVDDDGKVTDRRAGRIATEVCVELCALLKSVSIAAVEVTVAPEMEYRAAVIFRGEGLCDGVTDSDPQVTDQPPLPLQGATAADRRMVEVAEEFLQQAGRILADQSPANMVLIRGFGRYPEVPPMQEG